MGLKPTLTELAKKGGNLQISNLVSFNVEVSDSTRSADYYFGAHAAVFL